MPRNKYRYNERMANYMVMYRKTHFFTVNQIKAALTIFLGKEPSEQSWRDFEETLIKIKLGQNNA